MQPSIKRAFEKLDAAGGLKIDGIDLSEMRIYETDRAIINVHRQRKVIERATPKRDGKSNFAGTISLPSHYRGET